MPHDNPSHCMLHISFIWLLFLVCMVNIRFEYANKQSWHISNTNILLLSLLENTVIFKTECWCNKKVQLECDCLPCLYVSPEIYCFKLCLLFYDFCSTSYLYFMSVIQSLWSRWYTGHKQGNLEFLKCIKLSLYKKIH